MPQQTIGLVAGHLPGAGVIEPSYNHDLIRAVTVSEPCDGVRRRRKGTKVLYVPDNPSRRIR